MPLCLLQYVYHCSHPWSDPSLIYYYTDSYQYTTFNFITLQCQTGVPNYKFLKGKDYAIYIFWFLKRFVAIDKWNIAVDRLFPPFFIISDMLKKNSLTFFSVQKEFSLDEMHENTLFSIRGQRIICFADPDIIDFS